MSISAMVACRKITVGSPTRKAVLLAMADVAWDNGSNIWISTQTLCDYTELCRRAVINAVDALVEAKILLLVKERKGQTSIYSINPKIMDGTWGNPCTTSTSAPDAPVHDVHPTHAPDAPHPCTTYTPTQSPDAPDPNRNSIELNRTRECAHAIFQKFQAFRCCQDIGAATKDQQIEDLVGVIEKYHERKGVQTKAWWLDLADELVLNLPTRIPTKYSRTASSWTETPGAILGRFSEKWGRPKVQTESGLESVLQEMFGLWRELNVSKVPGSESVKTWASECDRAEITESDIEAYGRKAIEGETFAPTALSFVDRVKILRPGRAVVLAVERDSDEEVAARNLARYGTATPTLAQIRERMRIHDDSESQGAEVAI